MHILTHAMYFYSLLIHDTFIAFFIFRIRPRNGIAITIEKNSKHTVEAICRFISTFTYIFHSSAEIELCNSIYEVCATHAPWPIYYTNEQNKIYD